MLDRGWLFQTTKAHQYNFYKTPSSMSKCGKRCDLCSNYLDFDDNFVCTKFKERFRVHKSDITTCKDRCGVAMHFISKCQEVDKLANLKVQLMDAYFTCLHL